MSKMAKDNKQVYCVVKTDSRALGAVTSILLAIGGAVTATYALKYLAKRLGNTDEDSNEGGYEEDI